MLHSARECSDSTASVVFPAELRRLAERLARDESLSPVDLDRLAELANAAGEALRKEDQKAREALAERARSALAAFNLPTDSLQKTSIDNLTESIVSSWEAKVEGFKEADGHFGAAKKAVSSAFQRNDFEAVERLASAAKTAQIAVEELRLAAKKSIENDCAGLHLYSEVEREHHEPAGNGLDQKADDSLPNTQAPNDVAAIDPLLSLAAHSVDKPYLSFGDEPAQPACPTFADVAVQSSHTPVPEPVDTDRAELPAALHAALSSERLGLAEALVETTAQTSNTRAVAAGVRMAAIALVADGNGELDDQAREFTREALDAIQTGESHQALTAFGLLLPASNTLALLAPGSDQTSLLSAILAEQAAEGNAIRHAFPALCDLARIILQSPLAGAALISAPQVMSALVSAEERQRKLQQLVAEISAWRDTQSARSIRYAAATNVWHEVLRPGGLLGSLLLSAIRAETAAPDRIRTFLISLDPEAQLREVERQVRGPHVARRSPIEGPAWRELLAATEAALQYLRKWLALVDGAPTRGNGAHTHPIAKLRDDLRSRLGDAEAELRGLSEPSKAVAPLALRILGRLGDVLEGTVPAPAANTPDELLGRDLLSVAEIRFGAGWIRDRPLPATLHQELEGLASSDRRPVSECVRERIVKGDFLGADLAISLVSDPERAILVRELRAAVEERKGERLLDLDQTRIEVEEAERTGRVETDRAAELLERLQQSRDALNAAEAANAEALLDRASDQIREARDTLLEREKDVRKRIELRLGRLRAIDELDRERVEEQMSAGRLALAEDFVERLEAGEKLDTAPVLSIERAFEEFFPDRCESIALWLRARGPTAMRDIGSGMLEVPPSLTMQLTGAATADLRGISAAWAGCMREPHNSLQDFLVRLISGLGFTDPELVDFVIPSRQATEAHMRLRVRSLRERETAVLPQFGSNANGHYHLICVWRKRDVEDIAQAVAAGPSGGLPTIVLFFGPLDLQQRRRLAALARAGRLSSTIVIDETLTLHLAMLEQGRLRALFACTLPFTDCRAWADTGTPPPEMFFGRARELRAVKDASGEFTHLLYGGRQLGKTALLHQAAREVAAQPETVARYISIAEIGLRHPPAELWMLLAEELDRSGIRKPPAGADQRAFRKVVREWLDAKQGRRILLLLDEADEFFKKDQEEHFAVTAALRDLTVDTERRFKPVFAGLRNVQKLARDPNNPIAHLGMPMVIGPLLRGEERRQAEELVRWPFAALGYRMDDAVVSRVLTFANYYPSLIQVVCQRLLRILRQRSGGMGPPWNVGTQDVDQVLDMEEVRTAAFERFRITLELDHRYYLLTLLVVSFSIDDPELLVSGLDRTTLRELAASAWPNGFPSQSSEDSFGALLDEMVGLGLLRSVGGAHYALRSANLAHLIGNPSEIKRQIDSFRFRAPPAERDPLELRRLVGGRPGLLTARQEGNLLSSLGCVLRFSPAPSSPK